MLEDETNRDDPLSRELERLHAMLAQRDQLSESHRLKLQQLATDIESALAQSRSDDETDLKSQIDELVLEFETHHPTVTDLLHRITHGLANLGI
ncbi:MAG: DUF4404 family protein [Pirellulaceae bacterium]